MSIARRYDGVKRALDVLGSALGLALTAPIQVAVGLVVRVGLGRPILFRQVRPGCDGRPFTLIKFRTMSAVDLDAGVVADADRLGRLGRFLRVSSLDELPTLWNVLAGDMSFVGPRPLLLDYLPLYTAHQSRRHEVRPGITGLAQAAGRNHIAWEQRFALDVEYVDRRSLRLDAEIVLRTARLVLTGYGVNGPGSATMSPFRRSTTRGSRP